MASKIRIKMGAIEVEYEGSEEFLKKEIPVLLAAVADLYTKAGGGEDETSGGDNQETKPAKGTINLTTKSIAQKLNANSGPDLIVAAAAHLTLAKGKDQFKRKELNDAMKGASGYYKSTYTKNLTNYLGTLGSSGKLVEVSTDVYALTASTRNALEAQLA